MEFLNLKTPAEYLNAARTAKSGEMMSIRQLSGKLGYSSDRTVGMVLSGQRQMSPEMQARIVKFLKLTPKEQLHLQHLIRKERDGEGLTSQDSDVAKITSLSPQKLHPLIPAFSLVVLEILRVAEKPLSISEIHSRLRERVSNSELEATLKSMADAELLKSEQDGFFRALKENEFVTTSLDVPSAAIREIHRRQLRRAMDVLEEQSTADREFIAKTLSVASDRLPEFKRLLRQKLDELAEELTEIDSGQESTVVQLNLQFYLQSK